MLESNPSAVIGDDVVLGQGHLALPPECLTIHYIVSQAINSSVRLR